MNEAEMGDMISVSGSAPGGVAVNSATFIGYRLGGVAGAVAAVIAITLPTFLIVFLLSGLRLFIQRQRQGRSRFEGDSCRGCGPDHCRSRKDVESFCFWTQ
ncbi:chromate transporter [Paenibacillus rhizoplanae]